LLTSRAHLGDAERLNYHVVSECSHHIAISPNDSGPPCRSFSVCQFRYMQFRYTGFLCSQLRYIKCHSATMADIPSCRVLDSRHSQADLLPLKAYVEEMSRRVLFMRTHCCRRYSFKYLRCCANVPVTRSTPQSDDTKRVSQHHLSFVFIL